MFFLYQIPLIFLQKMDLLLKLTSPEERRQHILPMILGAMESTSSQVQVIKRGRNREREERRGRNREREERRGRNREREEREGGTGKERRGKREREREKEREREGESINYCFS